MSKELILRSSGRVAGPVLLGASTLTIMAAAIVSPSLPTMHDAFSQASPLLVQQVVTLTSAAIAVTAPFAGIVIQRVGSRPVLAFGLGLYAVAGTAGLWVPGMVSLLVSRAVLGVAVGMIMTSVSSSIAGLWSGPGRARMMSGQQAFASLGGVVFLPLAGLLSSIDWRVPFALYSVALLIVPFTVLTPLFPGHQHSAAPTRSAGRGTSALLVAFILGAAVIGTAVFFMVPTQLPFMLAESGLPAVLSGFAIAASTATGVIGALVFPRLRQQFGFGAIAAGSLLTLGTGWAMIGANGAAAPAGVTAGALVGGIGVGAIVPDLNAWLSDLVPGSQQPVVLGGLVAAIFGGQFLSPLIFAPFIDAIGLRGAFLAAAVLLAILAATVVAVSARTQKNKERTEQ